MADKKSKSFWEMSF